jgi:hypothetical protein
MADDQQEDDPITKAIKVVIDQIVSAMETFAEGLAYFIGYLLDLLKKGGRRAIIGLAVPGGSIAESLIDAVDLIRWGWNQNPG